MEGIYVVMIGVGAFLAGCVVGAVVLDRALSYMLKKIPEE